MNHLLKGLCATLTLGAACLAQTVNISTPSDGSTKYSPVTVQATASGFTQGVHVMQLYLDGNKVNEQNGGTLSVSQSMSTGDHRVTVQAVGESGTIAKKTVNITVIPVPTPTPTPRPTPTPTPRPTPTPTPIPTPIPTPTPSETYRNVQEDTAWKTCGACGNVGGTGEVADYNMTRGITLPALDGKSTSAQFWIGGTTPYINGYWYLPHYPAPPKPVKSLVYDFYIYIPQAYVNAPQAIEFECQQTVNGYTYNFAWQLDYGRDQWRTFDYVNKKWVPTSVPMQAFTGNTWHHIIAEYHIEGTNSVHDALTVDGTRTVVNIVRPAKYTGQNWESFTNAFQLDLNGKPTPYKVYVDRMNIIMTY